MSNKNYQIAKFYSLLFELKNVLNNDLLLLGAHIGADKEDAKLYESLEIAATDIEAHLENYELTVGNRKVIAFPGGNKNGR